MNYHIINRVDDVIIYVSNTPQQLKNISKASAQDWGLTIEKLVRISVLAIVLIGVVTLDVATFMYQSGHAFGQFVHGLNNKLTDAIVRKSTHSPQVINSWQLKLPIPALHSFVNGLVASSPTTHLKENQQLSLSTNCGNSTEDQRKEVGTTNVGHQSNASASSTRSKRSKQRSSSSKKQENSLKTTPTTTVGRRTQSSSTRSTQRRTRSANHITAEQ